MLTSPLYADLCAQLTNTSFRCETECLAVIGKVLLDGVQTVAMALFFIAAVLAVHYFHGDGDIVVYGIETILLQQVAVGKILKFLAKAFKKKAPRLMQKDIADLEKLVSTMREVCPHLKLSPACSAPKLHT